MPAPVKLSTPRNSYTVFGLNWYPPILQNEENALFPDNPLDVKLAALHGCWMIDDDCVFGIDHIEENMLSISDKYNKCSMKKPWKEILQFSGR